MNLEFFQEMGSEARIRELAPNEGWIIAQSFTEIQFSRWPDFSIPFERIFSGRIFSQEKEIRWITEGGITTASRFEESGGDEYKRECVRYYLWGTSNGNGFVEKIVPKLPADLPVEGDKNDGDRPYIRVYEYLPQRVDVATPKELMDALNRPRIAAHRFAGVFCGKDE